MSVYNHQSMVPTSQTRLLQLLDAIKIEYDQLAQDVKIQKSQRDEYEHKVNSQIQEMNIFQQNLIDLERTQQVMKKQYEEEIARLRQQLDHGGYVQPPIETKVAPMLSSPHRPPQPPITTNRPLPITTTTTTATTAITTVQPPQNTSITLSDLDPESVPANMKIEGSDWFALFNPKVPRFLKVDLLHTFDHDSVVCCVKFSMDGRYLAAGCNQATYIYDTMTSTRVAVLQDDKAGREGDLYIRSVSFSPDGKYLATGAEDRRIRIWDIQQTRIRSVLNGHEQDIYSLEFSRDGRVLVSGSGDRTTRVWDWLEGKCIHILRINEVESDPGVTSIAISPDSRLIAAGSLDKIVRIWDTFTGNLLEKLEGHKDSVYSVSFMPDGKTLVSGSLDKTLRLWRLGSDNGNRKCMQIFSGHKDFVLSVATTPDERWIVSGSKDRGVQFWDSRTGQTQFMLQGHKNSVISVATSPGRRPLFATGSGDNRARIWSYESLTPS